MKKFLGFFTICALAFAPIPALAEDTVQHAFITAVMCKTPVEMKTAYEIHMGDQSLNFPTVLALTRSKVGSADCIYAQAEVVKGKVLDTVDNPEVGKLELTELLVYKMCQQGECARSVDGVTMFALLKVPGAPT